MRQHREVGPLNDPNTQIPLTETDISRLSNGDPRLTHRLEAFRQVRTTLEDEGVYVRTFGELNAMVRSGEISPGVTRRLGDLLPARTPTAHLLVERFGGKLPDDMRKRLREKDRKG